MLLLSALINLVALRYYMVSLLPYLLCALTHQMVFHEDGRSGKGNDQMSKS
jgi:hypothetical protein